jgi:hypothetical protein
VPEREKPNAAELDRTEKEERTGEPVRFFLCTPEEKTAGSPGGAGSMMIRMNKIPAIRFGSVLDHSSMVDVYSGFI